MADIESKIRQAVKAAIFEVTGAADLKSDGKYLSEEIVSNLAALIAADRAGLEARIKAKDEALKEVRNYVVEQILEIISTGPGTTLPLNNAIAKIDKALKEGE